MTLIRPLLISRHLSIALFTALFISPAFSAADHSAVAILSQHLNKMSSMTAQFQQRIKDYRGTVLQEANGLLKVKRPRRFYWHTQQPYEHLVVTDGSILWLYDIDLEQITKQAFTADLDKAPALLLSGEIDEISKQFQVELLSTHASTNEKTIGFQLTPLSIDSLFKVLTIHFENQQITSMSLQDSFDQLTEIQFSEVKLNPTVDDKFFLFTPPDGIDVISNEP
ncbi:MAG: outer membrane lipoprotein chaperone LolA [Pseudomonadales bacterium]